MLELPSLPTDKKTDACPMQSRSFQFLHYLVQRVVVVVVVIAACCCCSLSGQVIATLSRDIFLYDTHTAKTFRVIACFGDGQSIKSHHTVNANRTTQFCVHSPTNDRIWLASLHHIFDISSHLISSSIHTRSTVVNRLYHAQR